MIHNTLKELIENFTKSRYEGHAFVLLFGSTSRGQQNHNSDIDLIVVYVEPIRCFREKVKYHETLFDVFIYDVESLNTHIHMARAGGNTTMLEIILTATPLPKETREFASLRLAAERIRSSPPLIQDINSSRQYLTSCLDDLESSSNTLESMAIAIEIFRVIEETILMLIGSGGFRKKFAARAMQRHDSDFYTRAVAALKRALDGNTSEIISVGNELLTQLGGGLREGYSRSLPEVLRMPLPVT